MQEKWTTTTQEELNFNAKKPNSNARGIEQAKKNSIYKPQKNSKA